MNEDQWGATEVLLLVLSSSIAVAYPIVTRRKLATPTLLRERVLFSPRGEIVAWTVVLTCYAVISGLPFVLLATRYPFLWGVVAMSISMLASVAWYVVLYRRMIIEMERELMSRYSAQPDPD
ncbi:hypothetical protein M3667_03220 [Microbacterium sp. P26]|uniref:hypothetical protein n=1 Tax=Microbacterium TaxID=33882 RepID=UPI00203E313C|nr:hypothetical protein [Microbacterium sp. P26]MCM3500888.1 hypothetical protein [Microbacterium sp. P26]